MGISLLRYAIIYVVVAIGLEILFRGLEYFAGIERATGASLLVPPLVAAMDQGRRMASAGGALPAKTALWGYALGMTAVVLVLGALQFGLVVVIDPGVLLLLSELSPAAWAVIVAVCAAATLMINRLFFGMGFKAEQKARARRADP